MRILLEVLTDIRARRAVIKLVTDVSRTSAVNIFQRQTVDSSAGIAALCVFLADLFKELRERIDARCKYPIAANNHTKKTSLLHMS